MIKWGLTFKAGGACLALMAGLLFVTPNLERLAGGKAYGPFVPNIIDGDTLGNGTERFRLVGVDACEIGQPIQFPDQDGELNCGYFARAFVKEFIGNQEVVCFDQGVRSYDRIVARCFVDAAWPTMQTDIGAFAIYSGWAVPTEHAGDLFKMRYLMEYMSAQLARRGAWNGSSVLPAVWRAANG
ncbi:Endonuclease YncB, thermonuclease family [Epibacterium ulvae]|uniref:Endonuclease YncB, thermonuclease family n=1 Tax=Epibacterium ulvae TaxID=1156985 RepID=A0A1G5RHD7_9RHOB|nr:thermonuclease family protein [Epibacterium ulvae]SCZ73542.1 Endonuclease YncB, thermonuclease family [Epibacterium ulvae]